MRIKLLFLLNGFLPDFIINRKRNLRELRKNNVRCSKYPPAFNIDVHVDDSKGVEMEGQLYTFKIIIIDESETDWVCKVQAEIVIITYINEVIIWYNKKAEGILFGLVF